MELDQDITSKSKLHKRLMNKAVHYLGRYQASQQSLRRILRQFARRKLDADHTKQIYSAEEIAKAIEEIIALCIHYGYVNDKSLAAAKARASVIAGQSAFHLSGKLQQMGIDEDTRKEALAIRGQDLASPELAAGIRAMRKKRLGPYHAQYQALEFADKQKQVAKLARAGFSMDLIRTLLAFETQEQAENALFAAEAPPDHPQNR